MPNMQRTSLLSDALGTMVRLRLSVRGIKTIEHNGGLDAFLLSSPDRELGPDAVALKRRVRKALAKKAASSEAA